MRASSVEYSRVKTLPGFCNEKVGIALELEDGEKAEEALAKARAFVGKALGETPGPLALKKAQEVVQLGLDAEEIPF